eukprot:TRINITY_DN1641_c0_g1_i1.p1 TRINITY_DN1641_c0_g1~~TRINITY_DN1641_c0_g1_i1.p1  ORF type:complete len:293 (+),score=46.02 TRINITY_DN1641_c0_g1_i1:77-880(+)
MAPNSAAVDTISDIIGWIYFFAWSFSFYPQVYLNWKRKSVVGLSLDYQNYNLLGFFCYTVYNLTLYFSPLVQSQYVAKYGGGIPVEVTDVTFAIHALVLTSITIFQCFIYEKKDQVISIPSIVLASLGWISIYIISLLGLTDHVTYLFVVYYFSYVKAGVTAVKYIPQAYMNFQRKSTVGWSIGNVLLDFTGGTFSFLQQFLLAINQGDWSLVYGNPAKLALSLLSVGFDLLFMFQHYVLYKNRDDPEEKKRDSSNSLYTMMPTKAE